ncbi:hypothetical protein FRC02_006387 [Tulasnella sp. 418]|nr:hypothetical protein FRC02_006387 [Tulasnella sp. 418]
MSTFREVPRQLTSWLATNGLSSTFSVASVGDNGVFMSTQSLRTSQSLRILNAQQCVYECCDDDLDLNTLQNIYTDGRITLQFEVFAPTASLVQIQGKGLVFERGSTEYFSIIPPTSNWRPRAIVSVSITKVIMSNAGPVIAAPARSSIPTTADYELSIPRRHARPPRNNPRIDSPQESWGWPVGGDSCCAS